MDLHIAQPPTRQPVQCNVVGPDGVATPPTPPTFGAEALAYFARMPSQPSDGWKTAADTLIKGLIADGVWSSLSALWLFNVEALGQELANVVSANFTLTQFGTVTLTARNSVAGDGSSGYYDTGFAIDDTIKTNFMAGCFLRGGSGTVAQMGCNNGTTNDFTCSATTTFTGRIGSSTNITAASATKPGSWSMQRSGSNHAGFNNGSSIATAAVANFTLSGSTTLLLMRRTTTFSPDQFGAAWTGIPMTSTLHGALWSRLVTFFATIT